LRKTLETCCFFVRKPFLAIVLYILYNDLPQFKLQQIFEKFLTVYKQYTSSPSGLMQLIPDEIMQYIILANYPQLMLITQLITPDLWRNSHSLSPTQPDLT
jgi:hypothetical protein